MPCIKMNRNWQQLKLKGRKIFFAKYTVQTNKQTKSRGGLLLRNLGIQKGRTYTADFPHGKSRKENGMSIRKETEIQHLQIKTIQACCIIFKVIVLVSLLFFFFML